MKYRVFGTAILNTSHICDCEYCDREHDQYEKESYWDVEADNETDAISEVKLRIDYFYEWVEVEAIPFHSHERPPLSPAGERELLRRWQAGEGLPAEGML